MSYEMSSNNRKFSIIFVGISTYGKSSTIEHLFWRDTNIIKIQKSDQIHRKIQEYQLEFSNITDAKISGSVLKPLLKKNIQNTFNAISCDGDTSTNDMVSIFSTNIG